MADTWGDDSDSDYGSSDTSGGSYGPRGPITSSEQRSGYTPPDNYSGYRGGAGGGDGPFGGGSGGGGWQSQGRGSNVTDNRPQSPMDVASSNEQAAAVSQGRGSNVTSVRPVSPVEMSSGVGPGGAVNAGGLSPTVPISLGQFPMAPSVQGLPLFATPAPVSQYTIGVPTINLNLPNSPVAGAFVGQNIRTYQNPTVGIGADYYGNTGAPLTGSTGFMYRAPQAPGFSKPIGPVERQDYLTWLEKDRGLAPGSLTKQHAMEVGSTENPDTAMSPTGALGPFQFTRGTAKSMGLINPLTGEDQRTDFIQAADAAANLNVKNAQGLASFLGRQPTAAELSIAYQQGLGGAKALIANPNMPAKDALSRAYNGDVDAAARAIRVNGGNPDAPASQFTGRLSAAFESMPSDLTKLAAYNRPSDLPSGPIEAGSPTGRTYTYDTMPKGPQLAGDSPEAIAEAARRAAAVEGTEGVVGPAQGGRKEAAQVASSSPQSFGGWLDSLFGTPDRISDLEAQGRYAGMDKQQYADQFTGGDISKVQSRIADFGQGPVVDYYAKSLGQALSEGFTAPFKAAGNLFSTPAAAVPKEEVAKAAAQNPQSFGQWLDGIFGTQDRINELEAQGRYAAMDKQQYADQFTGGDVSKVQSRIVDFGRGPVVDYYAKGLGEAIGEGFMAPFKAIGNAFGGSTAATENAGIKSLGSGDDKYNPNNLRPPKDIPETSPTEPDYTTGMELTPRVYSGNPLVAYNYDLLSRGYTA